MKLPVKTISILGATGSIGCCAADVIASDPGRFDVQVVTAHKNAAKLAEVAIRLKAKRAVIGKDKLQELKNLLAGTDVIVSDEIPEQKVDLTLAAIVGMAGLRPLMQAIKNSKCVAIANKEPLVAAGQLVMAEAKKYGTILLPVDSEHNAVFQVFDFERRDAVEKIILTASGGPFRTWTQEQMQKATPKQALAHPNWSMGPKISIDSATMMNKALEVIEAHYLFGLPPEKIEVVVHPQSVVHSMVEYKDGSVLAQMGASDMRTPLAHVLAWPDRMATPGRRLDIKTLNDLTFEAPDSARFPALGLAYEALKAGPAACLALNAANEVAVQAFIDGRITFLGIINCICRIMGNIDIVRLYTLEEIENFDETVRQTAQAYINRNGITKRAVGQ